MWEAANPAIEYPECYEGKNGDAEDDNTGTDTDHRRLNEIRPVMRRGGLIMQNAIKEVRVNPGSTTPKPMPIIVCLLSLDADGVEVGL